MKKYQIIYADPPWQYRHCASKSRKIENKYPTMTLEKIKSLHIPIDDNAILYLWATAPKLLEAIEAMVAWGFDYRTCAIWDKEIIGMGYWFRIQHELLLVGVKGKIKPPIPSMRISSIIKTKRGKHSDKPDYVKAKISEWYPDYNKLEMFAREHTPLFPNKDWDVWGNEVESDIEL